MKHSKRYIKRVTAQEVLLIPVGTSAVGGDDMLTLSEVGAFIYDHIEEVNSFDALVDKILEEYDADRKTVVDNASAFIDQLLQFDIITKDTAEW